MSMAVPMVSPMKMSELDTRDSFVLRPGEGEPRVPPVVRALGGESGAGPWRCHTLARIAGRCSTMPTDGRQFCLRVKSRVKGRVAENRSLIDGAIDQRPAPERSRQCGRAGCPPRYGGRGRRPGLGRDGRASEAPGAQVPGDRAGAVPYRRDQLGAQLARPSQTRSTAPVMPTAPTGMPPPVVDGRGDRRDALPGLLHVGGPPARPGEVQDALEVLQARSPCAG